MAGSNRPLPTPQFDFRMETANAQIVAQGLARKKELLWEGMSSLGRDLLVKREGRERRASAERIARSRITAEDTRWANRNKITMGQASIKADTAQMSDLQTQIANGEAEGVDMTVEKKRVEELRGRIETTMALTTQPVNENARGMGPPVKYSDVAPKEQDCGPGG